MTNPDITPDFPTSGQAMGFFIKSLEFPHKRLRTKTAQRYFSGSIDSIVLEKSRSAIFDAVAETLIQVGAIPLWDGDDEREFASSIADAIKTQAGYWDKLNAMLRPRLTMEVNPDNLPKMYASWARLVAIDLALRVGGYWHMTDFAMPEGEFEVEWLSKDDRGEYLNRKREEAGLTRDDFIGLVGLDKNSVDGWLYKGVRPYDRHIVKIASALTKNDKSASRNALANEIRRFYWFADLAELVTGLVGADAVEDMVQRIYQYAAWTNELLAESSASSGGKSYAAMHLLLGGTSMNGSDELLTAFAKAETDAEWKLDLEAAGGDWLERILLACLSVHNDEVDALIESSGGRLPPSWGASDPQAYSHYRKSLDLSAQGRWDEALAEVEIAARLDPNDPVNHYTIGSALSDKAYRTGDAAMMKRAHEEMWLAAQLAPDQILPWTEIGWIHIFSGRNQEARDHLLSVPDSRKPLDRLYYQALGIANMGLGDLDEALAAFESGFALEPNDKGTLKFALETATRAGDDKKRRKYAKRLRYLGEDDSTISLLSNLR